MHKLLRLVIYVAMHKWRHIAFLLLGNHKVYNLQASSDDDKKKWIKFFQEVIEQLLN